MDGLLTMNTLFIYRIDAEDRLIFVTPAWLDFARENDAAYFSKDIVQDASLFAFIADPETEDLYQIIIN